MMARFILTMSKSNKARRHCAGVMLARESISRAQTLRGCFRTRLLGGAARLTLPAASMALALGVSLASEANAQTTFNGTQATTYTLTTGVQTNPVTFGPQTNINTVAVQIDAVDGDAGTNWNINVQKGA